MLIIFTRDFLKESGTVLSLCISEKLNLEQKMFTRVNQKKIKSSSKEHVKFMNFKF